MKGWSCSDTRRVDLEGVVADIADKLAEFKLTSIAGDRYSANWVVVRQKASSTFHRSSRKSEAYLELAPLLSQGKIRLLDHPTQTRELKILEHRARAGGKESLWESPRKLLEFPSISVRLTACT